MERGAVATQRPHGVQGVKANPMFPTTSSLPPAGEALHTNSGRSSRGHKNKFKRRKNISTGGGPRGNSLPA
jgi:hypothetical protein